MPAVIKIKGLEYQTPAELLFENLSLTINRGTLALLTGHNGAGKSTLLKLILGLLKPSKGTIELLETPLHSFNQYSKIGYLPQNIYQNIGSFPLTAEELIASAAEPQIYHQSIPSLTKTFELSSLLHKKVSTLSGGQLQRVFLARSLINSPEILFLDEPTTGIDSKSRIGLISTLKDLVQRGLTVVLVTHDTSEFESIPHEVYCIEKHAAVSFAHSHSATHINNS